MKENSKYRRKFYVYTVNWCLTKAWSTEWGKDHRLNKWHGKISYTERERVKLHHSLIPHIKKTQMD